MTTRAVATSVDATSAQKAFLASPSVLPSPIVFAFRFFGCGPLLETWATVDFQYSYFVGGLPHAMVVSSTEAPNLCTFDL